MADRPPPRIFSPARRSSAWSRALARQASPDAARFVEEAVVDDMIERLQFTRLAPESSLVIGELGHALSDHLEITGKVMRAAPSSFDEERPTDGGPFDFIANLGTLATVNDLPGALLHLRAALAPDGLMMVSLVGAGSLTHLSGAMIAAEPDRAAPRMHPAIDTRSATALLERAGFRRFVVDSWPISVGYRALDRVVDDLRDQALGNQLAQPGPALSRAALDRARAAFVKAADEDGRVVERFEILTLTGWA